MEEVSQVRRDMLKDLGIIWHYVAVHGPHEETIVYWEKTKPTL